MTLVRKAVSVGSDGAEYISILEMIAAQLELIAATPMSKLQAGDVVTVQKMLRSLDHTYWKGRCPNYVSIRLLDESIIEEAVDEVKSIVFLNELLDFEQSEMDFYDTAYQQKENEETAKRAALLAASEAKKAAKKPAAKKPAAKKTSVKKSVA